MAKELKFAFTDYVRLDGGSEKHGRTAGDLVLGPRWTLHFKGLGKQTRYGGMTRYRLLAQSITDETRQLPSGSDGTVAVPPVASPPLPVPSPPRPNPPAPTPSARSGCRVTVTDNETDEKYCAFTLPRVDPAEFNDIARQLLSQLVAAQKVVAKRDADGTWWTAPGAFKALGWRGEASVSNTSYLGGWSGHPRKHGETNRLEVSASGVSYSGIKRIFSIPWAQVEDLIVEGPEQAAKRITATRMVTMGVFALAAKKQTKTAVLIVNLRSGEQAVFQSHSLTASELRGKLAPVISLIRSAERKRSQAARAPSASAPEPSLTSDAALSVTAPAPSPAPAAFSVADELTKLRKLTDEGILTEEQFAQQRDKLLRS